MWYYCNKGDKTSLLKQTRFQLVKFSSARAREAFYCESRFDICLFIEFSAPVSLLRFKVNKCHFLHSRRHKFNAIFKRMQM
jgi:hypothetical protein